MHPILAGMYNYEQMPGEQGGMEIRPYLIGDTVYYGDSTGPMPPDEVPAPDRPSGPGFKQRLLQAIPRMVNAGIDAATTPNIAGGRGVDVLRALGNVRDSARDRDILTYRMQQDMANQEQQRRMREAQMEADSAHADYWRSQAKKAAQGDDMYEVSIDSPVGQRAMQLGLGKPGTNGSVLLDKGAYQRIITEKTTGVKPVTLSSADLNPELLAELKAQGLQPDEQGNISAQPIQYKAAIVAAARRAKLTPVDANSEPGKALIRSGHKPDAQGIIYADPATMLQVFSSQNRRPDAIQQQINQIAAGLMNQNPKLSQEHALGLASEEFLKNYRAGISLKSAKTGQANAAAGSAGASADRTRQATGDAKNKSAAGAIMSRALAENGGDEQKALAALAATHSADPLVQQAVGMLSDRVARRSGKNSNGFGGKAMGPAQPAQSGPPQAKSAGTPTSAPKIDPKVKQMSANGFTYRVGQEVDKPNGTVGIIVGFSINGKPVVQ